MPLYAWKCPKCGHRFEVLCSIEKSEEAVCEKCGEKAVRDYTGSCAFGTKGARLLRRQLRLLLRLSSLKGAGFGRISIWGKNC